MRRWCGIVVVVPLVLLMAVQSWAVDFDEYTQLVQAAEGAHGSLEGAAPDLLPALREHALERDLAVIQWLDDFFASEEFTALPTEQQGLAYRDRYRNEFNASRLLIDLDRCEEARDRVRSLLESGAQDEELRPRLTETYENALACVSRSRVAHLSIAATPADARILVDGEFLGLVTATHDVDLGEHTLTIQADGYFSEESTFVAQEEGEQINLGPFNLVEEPPATVITSSRRGPEWYEWTLWGVGAAGIGVGTAMLISASSRQDDIDNPPAGKVVLDPEAEQDIVDQNQMFGIIGLGVGGAAAIGGTISFLLRGEKEPDQTAWNGGFDPMSRTFWIGASF